MAEIKTIYKGESVTLLFTFPALYDMARLASHKIFVGETEFTGVVEGQAIKMQLKSSDTNRMIGTHRIVCLIDDTTLGLRKPYCGELVIAKTQASGSTTSVSNISDIIIPIVISETAVTVDDILYNYVKGDKGDAFLYDDFTPEQIAELQQPAADTIASIVAVELAVEQAEALRVQAEIDRQTNTGTAIQNAETATGQANDAAALANSKATLANDAATNANTKAGLADTAATNANTKAGLANTAATNADNARLAIQGDLALKENTSNKQNSLATDGTGVKFPTVDAVNAGFIAFQEALFEPELATYISGLTTPITFANKQKINNLIKEIKNVCNITRLTDAFDAMYLFANETAECALRNMVKRAHDCTVVNSLEFTQYEGFIRGDNKYLNTNYAPITQAVRFQQNSASIGAYGVSSGLNGNYRALIKLDESDAGYESIISISQVGTASFTSANSATGTSLGTNTSISAMVISSRTTASLHKAYWNGIYKAQSTAASVAIPATSGNFIIYDKALLGYDGKCAFAFIGKGLSDEQAFGVTMAIENYMDSNGKGIII